MYVFISHYFFLRLNCDKRLYRFHFLMLSLYLSSLHIALAEALSISGDRFKCLDGSFIDVKLKCNQVYNCADQSDEAFETCYNTICNEEDEFKCGNGGCIPIQFSCNGTKECLDGSDENKFVCANDTTIEELLRGFRGYCGLVLHAAFT